MTTTLHRKASTRAERRRRERKRAGRARRSWIPLASVAAVIVIAALIAVMVTGGSGTIPGTHETAHVSIAGNALPAPKTPDPAVGMRAPVVMGTSFDGGNVILPVAGTPTVVVFLAHWCPHCRNDAPQVQSWINSSGMTRGVQLLAVSTWVDRAKPNYPPSSWLHDVGWTSPVLVDDTRGSTAAAYGLQGTPMWVFIGADGNVKFRIQGELTGPQLGAAATRLLAG